MVEKLSLWVLSNQDDVTKHCASSHSQKPEKVNSCTALSEYSLDSTISIWCLSMCQVYD